MIGNIKDSIQAVFDRPLLNAENHLVELGSIGTVETVLYAEGLHYFTFGFESSHNATISMELANNLAFTNFFIYFTLPVPAGTYASPYQLPAPMNGTGQIILPLPFVRVRLLDTAAINHTHTNFYMKAWW